jgi:hypothetical protein
MPFILAWLRDFQDLPELAGLPFILAWLQVFQDLPELAGLPFILAWLRDFQDLPELAGLPSSSPGSRSFRTFRSWRACLHPRLAPGLSGPSGTGGLALHPRLAPGLSGPSGAGELAFILAWFQVFQDLPELTAMPSASPGSRSFRTFRSWRTCLQPRLVPGLSGNWMSLLSGIFGFQVIQNLTGPTDHALRNRVCSPCRQGGAARI